MGRRSRETGKRGERQWRDECRAAGYEARRTAQHRGSPHSADVEVEGLPIPIHWEVKVGQCPPIRTALEQARRDCGDPWPVVASKKHREGWIVSMEPELFWRLIRNYQEPDE